MASLIETLVDHGVLFPLSSGTEYVVTFRLARTRPKALEVRKARIDFPFVPPSFIERLIARLHDLGDLQHHWKGGAMLNVKIGAGCGVFDFTDVATWMTSVGVNESRSREYAAALTNGFEVTLEGVEKTYYIVTADELTEHIEAHGNKLPKDLYKSHENMAREALIHVNDFYKLTATKQKERVEEVLSTVGNEHERALFNSFPNDYSEWNQKPLEDVLADFGINSTHCEQYQHVLEALGISTAGMLDNHVKAGKSLPPSMTKNTDADFIVQCITETPVRPREWPVGEVELRMDLAGTQLVAAARGLPRLVDRVLVLVRMYISELQKDFPGLDVQMDRPTGTREEQKKEAAETLLFLLAKRAGGIPEEVVSALPRDSLWCKTPSEVQSWLKDPETGILKRRVERGAEKVLRCGGRALLSLCLPAKTDSKQNATMILHTDLLRKSGFIQGLKLGGQLSDRGTAFWNLVARQQKSGGRERPARSPTD